MTRQKWMALIGQIEREAEKYLRTVHRLMDKNLRLQKQIVKLKRRLRAKKRR